MSKYNISSPVGSKISCKNWQIEAPYRMIQNNLDPNPMEFQRILLIEDVDNFTRPISCMKNSSNLPLNLVDYLDTGLSYRWRIDRLEVKLLDDQGNLIPSNSPFAEDRIRFQITNPNVFNNTNGNREQCTFVGKYTKCLFSYITDAGTFQSSSPLSCLFKKKLSFNENFSVIILLHST